MLRILHILAPATICVTMEITEQGNNDKLRFEHARDHLANERTFLAWIRTSLGITGLGFVVVKFSLFVKEVELMVRKEVPFHHTPYSLIVGILLVAIGAVMTIIAYIRYKQTQQIMKSGQFEQSNWPIKLLSALLVLSSILLIFYLIEST